VTCNQNNRQNSIKNINEILSHRLRGFDTFEHTEKAIRKAVKSDILYLEIDTRVTKDGVIFVCHDAIYETIDKNKINITQVNSSLIYKKPHKTGHQLLILDRLLKIFSTRINQNQKLCIDIKDFGYEKEHLKLVQKYNLADNIIWVSWIPQTLLVLHKLVPTMPKVLSFMPLQKFGIIGSIFEKISIIKIPFINIVVMGKKYFNTDLKKKNFAVGFQHAYLAKELSLELLNILKESNGGICIQKEFFTDEIKRYSKQNHLALLLFSINSKEEYEHYSKYNANILFADSLIFDKSDTPNSHDNN